MTVQAPLIYAYPLREWTEMCRQVSPRAIRLTSGQLRSLHAIGDAALRCNVLSDAVKEAVPRINRPRFARSSDSDDSTDFLIRNNPWTLLY